MAMPSEKSHFKQPPPTADELPPEAYPVSDQHNAQPGPSAPAAGGMPTIDDPFNFPTDEPLPAYSAQAIDEPPPPVAASSSSITDDKRISGAVNVPPPPGPPPGGRPALKPIAIPQVVPDDSSPFLTAYPPCLLARGIPEQSWTSFLSTVSAFLTAKIGDRAISHAGDMAKHFASDTTHLGKSIASQSVTFGKEIASHAKRGNIFGVAATAIAGVVTLPIMTAVGIAGTAARLPTSAIGAVTKKPKTAAERVNAYNVVANEKWFHPRGLHAQLVDTPGLSLLVEVPVPQLLAVARSGKEGSATGMLHALDHHIEALQVPGDSTLGLSERTLWLVLVEYEAEEVDEKDADDQTQYKSRRELRREMRDERRQRRRF